MLLSRSFRALGLAVCVALAFPCVSPAETCPQPEMRTSGVNFNPSQVDPGDLSTAPLTFEVTASFLGEPVDISSKACGSGCRKATPNRIALVPGSGQGESGESVYDVYIVRFAKSGHVDQGGFAFDWLVRMEECDGLAGTLRVSVDSTGQPVYPGQLTLSGRMVISMRVAGTTEVMNLRSRTAPVLSGSAPAWPPYGMVLTLANGPIPYFDEQQIDDPAAEPVLLVTGNTVTLGTTESGFQKHAPTILSAEPLASGSGGLRLTWESTAGVTECPVAAYHIYRNPNPGRLDTWALAASVPADQTSYVDTTYDGTPMEYMVIHATRYPFSFEYEGGLGQPVLAPAASAQVLPAAGRDSSAPERGSDRSDR